MWVLHGKNTEPFPCGVGCRVAAEMGNLGLWVISLFETSGHTYFNPVKVQKAFAVGRLPKLLCRLPGDRCRLLLDYSMWIQGAHFCPVSDGPPLAPPPFMWLCQRLSDQPDT